MALVALGVTGGIGAYKAVEVARGLQKHGHDVAAVLTRGAQNFVGPLTFEAITRRPVVIDQWAAGTNADIEHISLASTIDLLVVAPATAHTLARFAHGLADDFLTSLYLATKAPVLVAPAMNTHMLDHPATQANLATLAGRGVHVVEPGEGFLACGWVGKGRLAEPDDVVAAAVGLLAPVERDLAGRTLLVAAGPTFEDLDPVRFIGNRSSGKMGLAIVDEAVARGARVVLVLGPSSQPVGPGVELVRTRSAAEMHTAVMARAGEADAIVMAAAVADYTPAEGARPQKVAKTGDDWVIRLTRTRDILADLGAWRGGRSLPVLVGFAAETEQVVERGRAKREAKRADLIVANDVSGVDAGFEVDANAATIIGADAEETVPLGPKRQLAGRIVAHVVRLLAKRRAAAPEP